MCYHFSLSKKQKEIEKFFGAKFSGRKKFKPVYHASAFSLPEHPVILNESSEKIHWAHWGLIPFWVKDEERAKKLRMMTANAKSETIFEKPSFRSSIGGHRCLVPVDGFYEWRTYRGKKYPYYIQLKNKGLFSLAGIWSDWTDKKTGEILRTFSVITTRANPFVAKIHKPKNRMPVIFGKREGKKWLQEGLEKKEIKTLMKPYDGALAAHTVSKLIVARDKDTNVEGVRKEFEYEGLPA